MNVHISGIPFTATEEDVSVTLSKELHSNLFKSISQADHGLVLPFNFSVTFFGRKRNRGQVQPKARTAFLTLPSIDIAEEFLKHFTTSSGIRSIEVHGSRLQFGGIECERPQYRYVDNLRRRPFIAPAHARAKEEKENQLKESISAKYLSFGWRCRNGAYSSEWTCKRPDISFQDEERELHISLSLSSRGEVRCAVLQYHNILSMEITSFGAHPSILITLEKAPAFREEWNSREREIEHYMRVVRGEPRVSWADDCYDPIPRDSIMREMVRRGLRTALLNFNRQLGSNYDEEEDDTPIQCDERLRTTDLRNLEGHAMIAQFTSTSLLVTFESEQDRHTFERLCAVANLRKRRQRMILTVSRQLFSVPNLQRIQSWLAKLNWTIAFQCLSLLHRSLLNPVELFQISAHIHWLLSNGDVFWAEEVMITFGDNLSTLRKDSRAAVFPKTVMDCLLAAVRCITPAYMSAKSLSSANMLKCRHVTFTPTNMLLDGPYLEASNRVLREYSGFHDCFLRVTFGDEGKQKYFAKVEADGVDFVQDRFGTFLHQGFDIAGKHFEFLAYSSSSLKKRSFWFCTPFEHPLKGKVTAPSIRDGLGDFERVSRCPARLGARMAQAFSSTDPTIVLTPGELRTIPDIKRNESLFTDGVGTMSEEVADAIWDALRKIPGGKHRELSRASPSAYQIRIGGHKGMLSIDHTLIGSVVCVRPSMDKFDAPNSLSIEVAEVVTTPKRVYLNQDLISVLETLGVQPSVFLALQQQAVAATKAAEDSFFAAAKMLESHSLGGTFRVPAILTHLHKLGLGFASYPDDLFLQTATQSGIYHGLRDLKQSARIPVKGNYTLFGIADVHSFLKEGQIFACIDAVGQKRQYLEGKVLVTRSPCIHPGDVQIVHAIGRPPVGSPFEHDVFPNCVVFSCQGKRSLPSCLGGGDLDGDIFNLITLPALHPPRTVAPAAYTPAPLKTLHRKCTIDDIADFVVDFINSDILGLISKRHRILADQSDLGVEDPDCLYLAELHSKASDFVKSGTPVDFKELPRLLFPQKPDWSAGEYVGDKTHFYTSEKALGQLFRAIRLGDTPVLHSNERWITRPMGVAFWNSANAIARRWRDPISNILCPLLQKYIFCFPTSKLDEAGLDRFLAYRTELRSICAMHALSPHAKELSEAEIFIDTNLHTANKNKRSDEIYATMEAVVDLVNRVRLELVPPDGDAKDSLRKAWCYWTVSVTFKDVFGAKTFGWVALGIIFDALKTLGSAPE